MNDAYAALRLPEFRLFLSARVCLTVAIQIQAVVVGWQVYEITKDELALGLIGLAEAIPYIIVSLYAGHVADVVERKKIIMTTIGLLAICSIGLFSFTLIPGFFLAWRALPIYAVIFLSGIARGFLSPALFAFMPQLVPTDRFKNAITWNSTFWEASAILGPALGGIIYTVFDVTVAYAVVVVLLLTGMVLALLIKTRPLPPATKEPDVFDKIRAGLNFVFGNKLILSAISLDLFAVLFGGAVALLPIFAEEILHVGAWGLGLLRCAPSVGAVLMAFYIAHNPIKRHMGKILLWAVAGFGLSMIAFALSQNFFLSLALLMVSGGFDCVSVIIRSTLLQTLTPENMKGRVSAVNNIFIGSSNEIGMFESGVAARLLGVVPSVIFGGCMTLGVVSATAWLSKSLRRLQNLGT
ncbi:MAG: MFS transporter [Cyclobacteriaceae bacterium]|jgi:MFS family permease|nr:MFS transporter [Cyclobacteriaceae bacterium]